MLIQLRAPVGKIIILLALLLSGMQSLAAEGTITAALELEEALRLAVTRDPRAMLYGSRERAMQEQAIAAGELPDPALKLGIMSIPMDSFDFNEEPMSQLQLGLSQKFPPGKTLQYRREYTEMQAEVENARQRERLLFIQREVRLVYMEIYYQTRASEILRNYRNLFAELTTITRRQYAAGRDNQHDVLRAELELALIDDRIIEYESSREAGAGELSRYIGRQDALRPLPVEFPEIEVIAASESAFARLERHPLVQIEDAELLSSRIRVQEVEQEYKPGFSVDLGYSWRAPGRTMAAGTGRPDLLSAMVMIDVPLFTGRRQDRRLAAAKLESQALQYARTDRLYDLSAMLESELAIAGRLEQRYGLYEQRASLDARRNSEATLRAYQSDLADFTTLLRARLTELDTQLEMLRVRTELLKSRAKLLYLLGEKL